MKLERAQELYSDYAEGTLTPALQMALEQHFDADPSVRADYEQFSRIYTLMEMPDAPEVEVPLGFRAKILERVSAEQAKRDTSFSQRAANTFTGWFSAVPHRRAAGGAFAALAAAVMLSVLFFHPSTNNRFVGNLVPGSSVAPSITPEMIREVDTQPGTDGNTYHLFHLHLPATVPAATVNAYVVTATEQITDPAHLSDATPALKDQHLTNHQGVQIPIAPQQTPPVGSTLNLLVQWTPDDPKQTPGSEVVFTPFGVADPAMAAPANANFLDAMQAVASHYGATVMLEADAVPTQTVTADFTAADAAAPLGALAKSANFAVQTLPNNTYYVYDPSQQH